MVVVVRVVGLVMMMMVVMVVVVLLLLHVRAGTGELAAAAMTGVAFAALDRALSGHPHKCSRGALEVTRAALRSVGVGKGGGRAVAGLAALRSRGYVAR